MLKSSIFQYLKKINTHLMKKFLMHLNNFHCNPGITNFEKCLIILKYVMSSTRFVVSVFII